MFCLVLRYFLEFKTKKKERIARYLAIFTNFREEGDAGVARFSAFLRI